jgi:Spy/CpxP family protein refolding chaperone
MVKMPTATRARALGIALLATIFAAGALAGAAFERVADRAPAATSAPTDSACESRRKGLIVDQVSPTPEQRTRIDAILERRRGQMDAFWDGEGKRLRSIVDSTRNEIREVLTPEQRVEYDRLVAERRARKEREKAAERAARGTTGPAAGSGGGAGADKR